MLTYSQYDKRLILLVFIVLGLGQAHRSPTCYPLDHLSSLAYCVYAFCWKYAPEQLCPGEENGCSALDLVGIGSCRPED